MKTSADDGYREVGKAIEAVQQELGQLPIAPEALEQRGKEAVETVAEAVQ